MNPDETTTSTPPETSDELARKGREFWHSLPWYGKAAFGAVALLMMLPYEVGYMTGLLLGTTFGGLRDGFRRGSR